MILEIKLLKIIIQNYSSNLFYFSGFDQGNSALDASVNSENLDASPHFHTFYSVTKAIWSLDTSVILVTQESVGAGVLLAWDIIREEN